MYVMQLMSAAQIRKHGHRQWWFGSPAPIKEGHLRITLLAKIDQN
jgi:hypothetical protein